MSVDCRKKVRRAAWTMMCYVLAAGVIVILAYDAYRLHPIYLLANSIDDRRPNARVVEERILVVKESGLEKRAIIYLIPRLQQSETRQNAMVAAFFIDEPSPELRNSLMEIVNDGSLPLGDRIQAGDVLVLNHAEFATKNGVQERLAEISLLRGRAEGRERGRKR
jgi:hypothetical protein